MSICVSETTVLYTRDFVYARSNVLRADVLTLSERVVVRSRQVKSYTHIVEDALAETETEMSGGAMCASDDCMRRVCFYTILFSLC